MAKHSKPEIKKGGPYLAAAFLCENTIEDKQDGSLSAIRIIDQFNIGLHPSTPDDVPSETNRVPLHINGLLSFKTGNSPGEHALRLVLESPSGKRTAINEQTVALTPQPHGGMNIRFGTVLGLKSGGLFLIHVFLDGKRFTVMPFQVSIQRLEAPPPAPPVEGPTNGKKRRLPKEPKE